MTVAIPSDARTDLYRLLYERRWSWREKRVLLVLLTGARLLTRRRIEKQARVGHATASMVVILLEAHDMLWISDLGHYALTDAGRAGCLQILGLE